MRQRFMRVLALVGLAAGTLVGVQAVSADAAYSDCPIGSFCTFADAAGAGTMVSYTPPAPQASYVPAENTMTSVSNKSQYWGCLYLNAYYGLTVQAVPPNWSGSVVAALDNNVSSHKFAKSKSGCYTGYERCPDGAVCIFNGVSGRGGFFTSMEIDGNVSSYTPTWNEKGRSIVNRTWKTLCFYEDPAYGGSWTEGGVTMAALVLASGDSSTLTAPYVDSISSHKFAANPAGCDS